VKLDPLHFEKEKPREVFKTEVCPKRTLQKGTKISQGRPLWFLLIWCSYGNGIRKDESNWGRSTHERKGFLGLHGNSFLMWQCDVLPAFAKSFLLSSTLNT
jgi:hypothetical protein